MGGRRSVRIFVVAALVALFVAPEVGAPARVLEIPRTLASRTTLVHDTTARLNFAATHIAFSWWGDEGTGVLYRVLDASGWSEWRRAPQAHDMEHDGHHYSAVISVGRVHAVEHQALRPAGSRMGTVELSYLNTSDGPTRTVRVPAVANAAAEVPVVVTRAEWGADESIRKKSGSCQPAFYPLQQLLVHHTAGRNFDPDPYGTMRAIAWYHTVQRGWCDIGYNFVIGPEGTVFEGRWARAYGPWEVHSAENPEREVVSGAHASSYNSGSLGVSMMGNYDQVPLPIEARASLVNLLAWVADRHDLDPLMRYKYVNPVTGASRWLPRIAGHRTVGSTACPGDFLKLKQIRQEVALTIGDGKVMPSLSLASSSGSISAGESVALSGSLADSAGAVVGAPITIYQRPARQPWSVAGQATTSLDGSYSVTVAPAVKTRYRAVYAGDDDRWGTQSLLVIVRVRQATPSPS
ncbi:MAG: N-acetylmuramoyl-L-alanine amidase [Actinomycetota bacterium]|nr:N-acetylmuramoyl-L-alanine amidase [Actinomycetota bacterium]